MSEQLVVRLPEKQKFLLQNLAERKGISLSELIRTAIKKFLMSVKTEKTNVLYELGEIGEEFVLEDAPRDLSTNYKKYLYGKK